MKAWMDCCKLGWQTREMLWASSQVIAHRTARMATAGPIPSRRDAREFRLMGQEKVEAAAESLQAMTAQCMNIQSMTATAGVQQAMAATRALASMASSPATM